MRASLSEPLMDAEWLSDRLGGKKSGRQFKCQCVAHEDDEPSMLIFDGRSAVQVRCMAGCTQEELIGALADRGLWRASSPGQTFVAPAPTALPPPYRDQLVHRELARALWQRTKPCDGTIGQNYFEGREIWSVARTLSDVQFCQACARGERVQPAIVVAMRNVSTRAVTGVQRIFLKVEAGAVVKDGAMMLGSAGGAAMQLMRARETLHIAEGLETACAVIAMDHKPVWAMGSASLIQSLPVIGGVKHLVIWADHDAVNSKTGRRAGAHAAEVCRQRWVQEGRRVTVRMAKVENWDALDVWRARLAAQ